MFFLISLIQSCSGLNRKRKLFQTFGEMLNDGQRFFPIFHHIAAAAAFHHGIGGAAGVEFDSRKEMTVFTLNLHRGFYQGFLLPSVDLGDGLLVGSGLQVLCHLLGADEEAVHVHKFGSEREGVVGMSEFFENFFREKSGCAGRDSVHWGEAEVHSFHSEYQLKKRGKKT